MFPRAHVLGCSTGGQIRNDDVTTTRSRRSRCASTHAAAARLRAGAGPEHSRACGDAIGRALEADDLAGIFVLSDGLNVNGSELVAGITGVVGARDAATGGLAGDGALFEETLVGADCAPQAARVAAIGSTAPPSASATAAPAAGTNSGRAAGSPARRGNVLFELDGEPALDLYERYLGEDDAKGLPGTALLFPLRIRDPAQPDHDIVRTILAVDREARSMTFAGDVPEGWVAQLMRGNFDRLAAGAAKAARQARAGMRRRAAASGDQLAVLVSCIGRRLLMGQHTIDEVEAAGAELGADVPRLGFYSYGEISPHGASGVCELHNQTMTVTAITEAAG